MKCFNHPEIDAVGVCTSCGKNICSNCAMEIGGKIVCKSCAEKMANQTMQAGSGAVANHKEPLLAVILSFFIPGLGQIYNGQVGKGLALILGFIISILLVFVICGIFTYLAIWLYAMYDGYVVADKINKGIKV